MNYRLLCAGTAAFVLTSLSAAVNYSDGTFLDSDWSMSLETDAPGSVATFQHIPTGGNAADYQQQSYTLTAAGGVRANFVRNGAVYNPSTQGALSGITFFVDLMQPEAILTNLGIGYLIVQNGKNYRFFVDMGATYTPGQWYTLARAGLTAANFGEITGQTVNNNSHPNFSITGSEMKFGITNRIFGPVAFSANQSVDNWAVTTVPVPEPTSLMCLGALALALCRRRLIS